MSEPSSPDTRSDAQAFALRGRPRPVIRFRKAIIIAASATVSAAVIGLTWIALDPPSIHVATAIADRMPQSARAPADVLAGAPSDYGDVPRLGPPLPGDLGRPILEHQRELGPETVPDAAASMAADNEAEQAAAALRAARASALIAEPNPRASPAAVGVPAEAAAVPPPSASTAQERKLAFASLHARDNASPVLQPPVSRWMIAAGTIIPASLITGINSDLPGIITAQVTENVRDSREGTAILVPQGARLIGRYDSTVDYGQRRALIVWERLLLPDGASLALGDMPATDALGYAGLRDKVNAHGWQLFKAAVLSSIIGVGAQASTGRGSEFIRAIREAAQQGSSRAGEQLIGKSLEVQPTLVVRPGWPVLVLVNRDIALDPWKE